MNLVGERIVLRALKKEDMPLLNKMINDESFEHMVVGWSLPVSMDDQMKWFNNVSNSKASIRLSIEVKESREFIGIVVLGDIDLKNRNASCGVKITESSRGKGYAKEALSLLIDYGFNELNLHKLYANIMETNLSSKNLFTSLGFSIDGKKREHIFKMGKYIDLFMFSLVKKDRIG